MPTTYAKNTVNNVVVYTRNTSSNLAHGESKILGSVSIDSKLSNSTDYAATYVWSVRKLDANGNESWETLSTMATGNYSNTDTVSNFAVRSEFTSTDATLRNKINLSFKATNTATLWESYTGNAGELPCLGSNATVKVDIAWHDKHNAGLSGTQTKYFRFEFPAEMQSEDPSWTFDVLDETNAIVLE